MNKTDTIKIMNSYGKKRIPFLFIVGFNTGSSHVFKLNRLTGENIFFKINEFTNYPTVRKIKKNFTFTKRPVPISRYRSAFRKVMGYIERGDTYLINLTFPTKISTNLTLREIFEYADARYKLYFRNRFVVFSPETFVKIGDGIISSCPMKGTTDAALPHAREKLISDRKELAEHTTIVDLIRNDLSMVSKKVRLEKFRFVEKIKTSGKDLLQVSSKITGELESGYNSRIGEIMFTLLPAGSVSGAPKKKTVEIIRETERYNRGYYTGIFGYFDGQTMDSSVMIRFIENGKNGMLYKSGGGITVSSDMKSEYRELIDKVYVPIV